MDCRFIKTLYQLEWLLSLKWHEAMILFGKLCRGGEENGQHSFTLLYCNLSGETKASQKIAVRVVGDPGPVQVQSLKITGHKHYNLRQLSCWYKTSVWKKQCFVCVLGTLSQTCCQFNITAAECYWNITNWKISFILIVLAKRTL